jgi:alpha-ketoglutarate-dependent 2,4-dichlorophenoxyacetate dioxygenase
MTLETRPLHPAFGIEILGVDVRGVDEATFDEIVAEFDEHSVLLFRGQAIGDDEQIDFSRRFGPLETTIRTIASQARVAPEISNLANVDAAGRLIPAGDKRNLFNAGNQMWHSDSSFKRIPALASLLAAREVPPAGGETEFASTRVAYAALAPAARQALEGKVAIHSFAYSRGLVGDGLLPPEHAAQVPPVPQALVRANPRNGRKAFFVGSHACEIVGMPTDEARALLRDLLARATRPDLVYTHRWRPGDMVIWDNRCVLHRGRPWDESVHRRVMHRTTVAGEGPTAADVPDARVTPARPVDVAWGRAQLAAPVPTIWRVFSGADGKSHLAKVELPIKPFVDVEGAHGSAAPTQPVTGITFRVSPPGYVLDWHCAPRRQYSISLAGFAEIEVGDGTVARVGPGDVVLAEDLTGQGHITRVVGEQPRFYAVVPLADA